MLVTVISTKQKNTD